MRSSSLAGSPRRRLDYLAGRAVMRGIGILPWAVVHGIGVAVGTIACALDGRHRRIALDNVAAALPGRSPREQRAIVRGAFRHFGVLLLELLKFGTLSVDGMMRRLEVEGEEHAVAAYARGRGVFIVSGHFGFWELQALGHGARLRPMSLLARALDKPGLNTLLDDIRRRTGNAVIYRQGTVRRVLRTLQRGEAVAVLIDQHVQERDAVMVDFFGRPAATTSIVAALALRTGAAIIPVFSLPLGGGRYRLIYEEAIEPPPADAPDAIHDFTARCTAAIERRVREHPELWLWMHRRWRSACGPREDSESSSAAARAHGGGAPCALKDADKSDGR